MMVVVVLAPVNNSDGEKRESEMGTPFYWRKRVGPSQLLEDVQTIDQAKQKAIEEFGRKFTGRLKSLYAKKE